MQIVKISSKGQVVIPKVVREQLGIQPKKIILLEMGKDHAVIRPAPDVKRVLKGILKRKAIHKKSVVERASF